MSTARERLDAALADRYRVERELGQGGMATVYLAEDLKHKRNVALKVLKPELAAVLGAERFVQEITTTAALQHPHILPLFDSGTADGFLFYVMPFIDGETLRTKLDRETQMGVEESVALTAAVADALDYAHRQGVIHRDIKPENILLHEGRPMVADFGIALAVSAAAGGRMTETGLSLGTPHYMSPEQATAEKEITARSDVYSLASVLYEMLAGNPPHVGASAQQIIMKIVTEEARPITEIRRTVPANVAAAVGKALEKLPADRFESAKAFASALTDQHFTTATTSTPSAVAFRRGRSLSRGLGVALAIATTVAAWALLRSAPPGPVSRYGLALSPEQAPIPNGFVLISSDGSKIVYLGPRESGSVGSQLWLKTRDQLAPVPIHGATVASAAALSPDDRSIAFVQGQDLRRMPLAGGASTDLARNVANVPQSLAWLDDGTILYVSRTGATNAIMSVSENGGTPSTIWSSDTLTAYGLSPLPGGRGALFLSCSVPCASSVLLVLDRRSGDATPLAQEVRFASYLTTGHLLMLKLAGVGGVVAPFDLRALSITGPEVAVLDSVATVGSYSYLAVSRNGTLVFRHGSQIQQRQLELVSIDRSGRQIRLDSSFTFSVTQFAGDYGWSLSPDGSKLAIGLNTASGDDIWIKTLPRGPLSRVTFGSAAERRPRWTPDGRSLTFLGENGGIYLRRADGTGRDSLLLAAGANEASFSPDGRWLLFRSGARGAVSGGRDIYGLEIGVDSAPRDLIVTDFDENAFEISPDGRWIAYESDETGRPEIFVRPFPNTRDAKVQVSNGGGIAPRWARNGRELYFSSEQNMLMAAAVTSSASFAAGEPQPLFAVPRVMETYARSWYTPWDVTRDGKFIMVRSASQEAGDFEQPLIVVENWFEELKQRMRR